MAVISAITTSWLLAIVNILGLIIINFISKRGVRMGLGWGLVAFNLIMILLSI